MTASVAVRNGRNIWNRVGHRTSLRLRWCQGCRIYISWGYSLCPRHPVRGLYCRRNADDLLCQSSLRPRKTEATCPRQPFAGSQGFDCGIRTCWKDDTRQNPCCLCSPPGPNSCPCWTGSKRGKFPMAITIINSQSILSLPGTLTATAFQTILDVEEGFGSSTIHGQSQIPTKTPLAYYFGNQLPNENLKLYRKYISRLALAVTSRMEEDIQGGYEPMSR